MAATLIAGLMFLGNALADPLDRYRWERRLLLVFAPDTASPVLVAQRNEVQRQRAGYEERDLTVIEVIAGQSVAGDGGDARTLRQRFRIDDDTFQTVLVGKDGGEKLRRPGPMDTDLLFQTIDAMPMRQREMRERL